MRIEALAFWESMCGRQDEWWRAGEHQDTDEAEIKSREGERREQ